MNNPRMFLLVALLALGYLVWSQWQADYGPKPSAAPAVSSSSSQAASTIDAAVPSASAVPAAEMPSASVPHAAAEPGTTVETAPRTTPIIITTDVLRVEIDPRGGSIVSADLLAYPVQPKEPGPVRLLDTDPARFFVAQSGLVSNSQPAPDHNAVFAAAQNEYTLGNDARLEVPLTWTDASGVGVRKLFVFERGSYVIDQRLEIDNAGTTAWTGNAYRQLQRVPHLVDRSGLKGYTNVEGYSFSGAAWYSPEEKFEKRAFDKLAKEPLNSMVTGGWVAMLQHYFFAAWIPPVGEATQFTTAISPHASGTRYIVRTLSPAITVAPGAKATSSAKLYVGPKKQDYRNLLSFTSELDEIAPGLSLTVDYGMFTAISEPLHWLLDKFHRLTGNWGFAIILLVLLIKLVFFKLSEKQYRSMAKMRKLQPRMAALKERYGDDKQKLNQAMLEFYQKEKINPLAGCMPMLIQIPVFFALYWVLLESVELRQAPFIGWIQNLTAPDPYFVLPVLNAAVMLVTQHLTPMTGMDPVQAKIMKFMPVVFSVLFAFFPAGLVLYWTVNGALGLAQQLVITRRIESGESAAAAKAK
ncbi:MAG TPA: membrane protein insertase YidC [Dokdonella sp.]|uniref:membrane protein insertase YidC n=1 Tax=Dokdonella sp. TaxID=2291710 RepID=UPI0025B9674C|nr:membrane protein insertase YidC [Dokdonella sp.]MBX3691342.1 membrane protein insertase YidC [Dokdonella sp.]MCW5568040.1 membrane protein insertase YidC [Dokdonella sp.]HNR90837.1 membrane protein insertase YidC [Dokdonella sp.]